MRRKMTAGKVSQMLPVFIQDTTSTTGAGLGSLVYNSSGLTAKYRRAGQSSWTTISLASATVGTYTSGGFVADGGGVTGGYELGLPDAAIAAGVPWVVVQLYGATNMLSVQIEIQLDAFDYQSATVLLSSGTGTGQLDFTSGIVKSDTRQWLGTTVSTPTVAGVPNVNAKTWNDLTCVALPLVPTIAGRTLNVNASSRAESDLQTWLATAPAALSGQKVQATGDWNTTVPLDAAGTRAALGMSSANLDTQLAAKATSTALATAQADLDILTGTDGVIIGSGTQTFNMTGNITGNLSGSVGSVTGNVGGNVAGSVASVTAGVTLTSGAGQSLVEQFFTYDATADYAGAAAGSLVKEIVDNSGGGAPPTAAAIADAVWTEAIADHSGTSGSTAESLNAAGGAGDPWITTLPGSYTGSQAGKILAEVSAGSVIIAPIQSQSIDRVSGDTLKAFVGEDYTFTVYPVDATGAAIDVSSMTLEISIEDHRKTDVQVIANGSINKTSTYYQFTTSAASANVSEMLGRWACRRTDTSNVIGHGPYIVTYAADSD